MQQTGIILSRLFLLLFLFQEETLWGFHTDFLFFLEEYGM